jgi:hypothetical protein
MNASLSPAAVVIVLFATTVAPILVANSSEITDPLEPVSSKNTDGSVPLTITGTRIPP